MDQPGPARWCVTWALTDLDFQAGSVYLFWNQHGTWHRPGRLQENQPFPVSYGVISTTDTLSRAGPANGSSVMASKNSRVVLAPLAVNSHVFISQPIASTDFPVVSKVKNSFSPAAFTPSFFSATVPLGLPARKKVTRYFCPFL